MEKKSSHIKKHSGKKNTCGQFNRSARTQNGPEKYNRDGGERESFRPSANEVYRPRENNHSPFEEDDIAALRARNEQLERRRDIQLRDNEKMRGQNWKIESSINDLRNRLAEIKNKMAKLVQRNEALEKENSEFRTKNAELEILQSDDEARYAQLEGQLENIMKQKNDLQKRIAKLSETKRSETLKEYKAEMRTTEIEDANAHIVERNSKSQVHKEDVEKINNVEQISGPEVGDITRMAVEKSYLKTLLGEVQDKNHVLKQTNDLLWQRIKDLEKKVKSS